MEAKCKKGDQKMLYVQVIRVVSLSATSEDFCGPVYIRSLYSESNEMKKAYIVVMTCSTSRKVHLELTPDLTKDV